RIEKAEALERERGLVAVPPDNDEKIIAGQGTLGLEILDDLEGPFTVLGRIVGGGLGRGGGGGVRRSGAGVRAVGVEPEFAAEAQGSLRTGTIQSVSGESAASTMADGLRSQSVGPINFEHIRKYVDAIVTVSEAEIRQAMRQLLFSARIVAEPSGAVATAAAMFHAAEIGASGPMVAVVSGGNIEPQMLAEILAATN